MNHRFLAVDESRLWGGPFGYRPWGYGFRPRPFFGGPFYGYGGFGAPFLGGLIGPFGYGGFGYPFGGFWY